MTFWSTEKFKTRAAQVIHPYSELNLKHGAYEMAVGSEAYMTNHEVRITLKEGDQIVIPSGQFALILTEESVTIPSEAIGFISIRATIKFQGLVNVSGFHVDPGFSGRLKFSVYNAGSRDIVLERGQRIFMIWLCNLDQETSDKYNGSKEKKDSISADDVQRLKGDIASPAALKKEIEELKHDHEKRFSSLEKDITLWRGIAVGILMLLAGVSFKSCLDNAATTKASSIAKQIVNPRDRPSQGSSQTTPPASGVQPNPQTSKVAGKTKLREKPQTPPRNAPQGSNNSKTSRPQY